MSNESLNKNTTSNNNNNNNNNKPTKFNTTYDSDDEENTRRKLLTDEYEMQKMQSDENNYRKHAKSSTGSWNYIRNLLNHNKLNKFESTYKKSYLAVTRLYFTYYIFYLILYSICWIIYYSIDNSKEHASYTNIHSNNTETNMTFPTSNERIASSALFIYLYSGFLFILLLVFVFLMYAELKEFSYKKSKNHLKQKQEENSFDSSRAEKNMKEAVCSILENEKQMKLLEKDLESQSESILKLRNLYWKISYPLALLVLFYFYFLCLISFKYQPVSFNQIGHYFWFCELILTLYLIYPFHFYLTTLPCAIIFTFIYELLTIREHYQLKNELLDYKSIQASLLTTDTIYLIAIKVLLHLSINLIGIYLYKYLDLYKRNTFLNVAHMHRGHMNATQDEKITETMIKSIMPPLFTHVFGNPEQFKKSVSIEYRMRPLYVYPVDEVSILYADIVGFTKMSSTKTAPEIVFLLNDLYGRFDNLCEKVGCEKLSTLGDCYYCVSGCLNQREDHAKCCVEMGLSMIKEINLFKLLYKNELNMRVGVHTGKALCGFIGSKRFRFDVWSSDVKYANAMESSGRPGEVHISQNTFDKLNGEYKTVPGEKYMGEMTYFVVPDEKYNTKKTVAEQFEKFNCTESEAKKATDQQQQEQQPQSYDLNSAPKLTDLSEIKHTETNNNADEESEYLRAVEKSEFYSPDVNVFTMCFGTARQEKEYYRFLMGNKYYDQENQLSRLNSNSRSNSNTTEQAQQVQQIDTKKRSSQIKLKKDMTNVFTNPRNTFFFSLVLSFAINLCVSGAYLILYIAAKARLVTENEANVDIDHAVTSNFVIYLTVALFAVLTLVQLVFICVYFTKFTTFFKKVHRGLTSIFELYKPSDLNASSSPHQQQQDEPPHHYHNSQQSVFYQQQMRMAHRMNSRKESENASGHKRTCVQMLLVYLVSFVYACLVPVLILTTSVPLMSQLLKSSTDTIHRYENFSFFIVYASLAYLMSLIHVCAYVQLNHIFKICMVVVYSLLYCVFAVHGVSYLNKADVLLSESFLQFNESLATNGTMTTSGYDYTIINLKNFLVSNHYITYFLRDFTFSNYTIVVDLVLFVILVVIISRQFELLQRLCFTYKQEAYLKIKSSKEQKDLANWLIEVVIPSHVVNVVKDRLRYSRNYDCVGVIFVNLCNFSEFYEENFQGGRELLRILNEITIDFDRLFDDPRYHNIEKIKTIGSSFMIASGLGVDVKSGDEGDEKMRQQHLFDLMHFALELFEKLETFNNEAMSVCNFKFQMRMGFNFGPVTAGIIGTERLLFDIWGNTVNVASRMESSCEAGFLQLTETAFEIFKNDFKSQYSVSRRVKGIDKEIITHSLNPKNCKL